MNIYFRIINDPPPTPTPLPPLPYHLPPLGQYQWSLVCTWHGSLSIWCLLSPAFSKKVEGHCFRLSVVRNEWCVEHGVWCVVPDL